MPVKNVTLQFPAQLAILKAIVGQSLLVSITYLGLTTIFLLLLYRCRFVDVGRSL
jgi:hypothetical protein